MTAEERVASLHTRMEARERKQERRKTSLLGAACAVLTVCLLVLVFGGTAAHRGGAVEMYSGSIMLFENAGGYVLTALIAFVVGMLATLLGLRYRERAGRAETEEPAVDRTGETPAEIRNRNGG